MLKPAEPHKRPRSREVSLTDGFLSRPDDHASMRRLLSFNHFRTPRRTKLLTSPSPLRRRTHASLVKQWIDLEIDRSFQYVARCGSWCWTNWENPCGQCGGKSQCKAR